MNTAYSPSSSTTQHLFDLQQRIPVVGDKALVDLINGIDVSRDILRYRKGRSFLGKLIDQLGGKDEKLQSLLNDNSVVGQVALTQWILELCDSIRISQVALQVTQNSLLEARNAIRRQHDKSQLQEHRLQSVEQKIELLSVQVYERIDEIEARLGKVELRVSANEDLERILAAWSAEQTYSKLPWVIQILLLVREVFSSAVITYELQSGDTEKFRELLTNRIVAASPQMPKIFFGLSDLLEQTCTTIAERDRVIIAGLTEVRSLSQHRLQTMPYLFTIGTTLELATLPSGAKPEQPAKCAIELCRNQIDDIPGITDTRKFVRQLIQETADDCLMVMTKRAYL
jgi:YjcZ-like protein